MLKITRPFSANTFFFVKAILFVIYLLFVLLLIHEHGVIDKLEALKYISAAKELASGNLNFFSGLLAPFSSYIIFLLPATLLGNVKIAIALQMLLTFTAANCLFSICKKITQSRIIGVYAMAVFLFNYFIQFWTIALFSESFFISISIILLYVALHWKAAMYNALLISCVSLIVIFARPQGILFILPCLFYILNKKYKLNRKLSNSLFVLLTLLIFIYSFSRITDCENIFRPIAESSIICGFPNTNFEGPLPENCTILSAHQYLIEKHGILYELSLFVRKSISLFTFTRPYYSMQHNLLIGLNYLLLLLSIVPLFFKTKAPAEVVLFFKIILLNVVLIGLTYDEWHGRYLAVMMPPLILLSAITMDRAIGLFRKKSEPFSE